jgi:hypothetical protein
MALRHRIKLAFALPLASVALACGGASTYAQTIILNQIGSSPAVFNSASSYASNSFTNGSTSSVLVDDFVDPSSALDITDVSAAVVGFGGTFVSLANVTGWEVSIYASMPTSTTSLVTPFSAIVPTAGVTLKAPYDTSAQSGLVSIPVNILLPTAGTYYLSVEAVNSLTTNGEVGVYSTSTGFLGSPAPFPSGGENDFEFTPGATGGIFNPVTTSENGDAAYEVAGVPEPSTWALVAAGGLALTLISLRRTRREPHSLS